MSKGRLCVCYTTHRLMLRQIILVEVGSHIPRIASISSTAEVVTTIAANWKTTQELHERSETCGSIKLVIGVAADL